MDADAKQSLHIAFCKNDAAAIRAALAAYPELKQQINAPIGPFDSPAICNVRTKEMLDVLLEAGADVNAKSQWWAGGFCLLDSADDDLAQYAIQRGARLEAHSAARLGMLDKLRELVAANPSIVNEPGGDGKRPLHFARNVEIAKFLLDHGAEIDAKDIDHESTPAQYLIEDHQDVVRFLIERGAKSDIFMAAALGDLALAQKHLDADPNCVRLRVNNDAFPMSNKRAGGTICFWTLGRDISPHQVAKKFGHQNVLNLLMDRSPPEVQLINHCWLHDEPAVKRLLAADPNLAAKIPPTDHRALADAAREKDIMALRLFLEAGLPVDSRGQHQATPLHWAAWHGDARSIDLLLKHGAPLELTDADHGGAPLQWAMHGSENSWFRAQGDYAAVARLLLQAGAKIPAKIDGTREIQQVIRSQAG